MLPLFVRAVFALLGVAIFTMEGGAKTPIARQVASGFQFTEGPTFLPDGAFIFSDIPADRLMRWDGKTAPTVFREPSGKANGNTTDREGRLITCEHWNRRVTRTGKDGKITVLADSFEGKPFNSPNDAVVKSDGTVWFTDPNYGAEKRGDGQPVHGVYRLEPESGKVTLVAADFDQPNGICFSPDEKKLYVADSGAKHHIRVFDVPADGALKSGAVFAVIENGGPDGIRCAGNGDLYSSEGRGAAVFAPEGTFKYVIAVPETPANLCFSPDGKRLYLTARHGLYEVDL